MEHIGNELAPLFRDLAEAARNIALAHFRSNVDFERKQDLSPVTVADRAIEQELRRIISARFPRPRHPRGGDRINSRRPL